jgi:phage-related minor tail protein
MSEDVNINVDVDTQEANRGLGSVGQMFEGLGGKIKGFAIGAATALAGFALAVGIKSVNAASDLDNAVKDLGRTTGATTQEMGQYKDTIKELYKSGLGESFQDIADQMKEVKLQTQLSGKELQNFTSRAMKFGEVFDTDVSETTRSAKMLMDQFGISTDEAFNLMVQGAQKGLDKNKDLLDTINEYGVHFKELGYTSEEMFSILEKGAKEGAFSIDKVGDAVKEFNIRSKDGSKTTIQAFKDLGFNAAEMTQIFAAGGPRAADAMTDITNALGNTKDAVKANETGVALFGTMFEDLGIDAIKQLNAIDNEFDKTKKSADKLNSTSYSNFNSALKGIGREIEVSLLVPLGEMFLPLLNKVSSFIKTKLPGIISEFKSLGATIQNFLAPVFSEVFSLVQKLIGGFNSFVSNLADRFWPQVQNIFAGFNSKFDGIVEAVRKAGDNIGPILENIKNGVTSFLDLTVELVDFWAKNVAPVIITALEKVIPIIMDVVTLLSEGFNNAVKVVLEIFKFFKPALETLFKSIKNIVNSAMNAIAGVVNLVMGIVRGDWTRAWNGIKGILSGAWGVIKNTVSGISGTIQSIFNSLVGKVKGIFQNIVNAIQSKYKAATTAVKNIVNSIKNTFLNIIKSAYTWGRNLLGGFIEGIKSKFGALINRVGQAADIVRDFLGFYSPAKKGPGAEADKWAPNFMRMYMEGFATFDVSGLASSVNSLKAAALTPLGLKDSATRANTIDISGINVLNQQYLDLLVQKISNTVLRGF